MRLPYVCKFVIYVAYAGIAVRVCNERLSQKSFWFAAARVIVNVGQVLACFGASAFVNEL